MSVAEYLEEYFENDVVKAALSAAESLEQA